MKNWYLRHRIGACILWMAVGFFALISTAILMLRRTGDANLSALLIPYALWGLAFLVIFVCEGVYRELRALYDMNGNCDPVPLLNWADTELGYWSKHGIRRKKSLVLFAMTRAMALCALGRNEEAVAALPDPKNLKNKRGEKAFYFLYMALFQLSLGHSLVASQYVQQAEIVVADMPQGKFVTRQCADMLERIRCQLLLADKKTDGLRKRLYSLLFRAVSERERVSIQYNLAKLARLENRPADARLHLEYVVENGNKLAIRANAQAELEALPEE